MDYASYASAANWPLISTIASIAGVLPMVGQQVGRGVQVFEGPALDDLRRPPAWIIQPWPACVAMLLAPLAFPGSNWVGTMRGLGPIESEMDLARADGYYEDLTRSSTDRRKPRQVERPAGQRSFTESGLVDEVPDYRRRALRPNLNAEWNGTTFRTGRLGIRGPEVSLSKPPGTFRVVVYAFCFQRRRAGKNSQGGQKFHLTA